ncbi:MAG: ABC transporter ATP-binding protein [Flavobacterium sp. BFFFF1]|uniref:ABC transporter ATP-binding protein n=1 Tax=Flavobacterium sp. BFFFF1 TaxID=2015557 RepID=UPI000BDC4FD9|nr:ABC transporter ATP-binding protein [Flavobacterium sp. BFFFF1]OYU80609.1 MAG: ABC transporter ATP-binding protein [Flavobacterium sp. BFFFF1]
MLQVQNISFAYDTQNVINNIDFTLKKGENLSVIGESGCGKSTLLKLIYGLYDLNEGKVFWNGAEVLGPKFHLIPGAPEMKYLAQDFDLMPYVTVAENVGKFLSNMYPEEKESRVMELLEMVEMQSFADVKAKYLSGGQQQRVALARVLALEPELLLLDEPFSNIDSFRKGALRRNLFAYLKHKGISCIIASHDSIDALSFSDKTLVMRHGTIVQFNESKSVYLKPDTKYTASLFGEVNEIPLHLLIPFEDKEKRMLLYAHELYLAEESDISAIVKQCYFKGGSYLVKAVLDKRVIFFENPFEIPANREVSLTADMDVVLSRL